MRSRWRRSRVIGCIVQTVYGASDAGVPTMTSIDDPPEKRRTVGRVLEGQELKLVRDGTGLRSNRARLARSPGAAPMAVTDTCAHRRRQARYGMPKAGITAGDMGSLDADGDLSIVGRKKDMIIRGGRNINPQQIETVLAKHPKVAEAAVVAVSDDVLGEIVARRSRSRRAR